MWIDVVIPLAVVAALIAANAIFVAAEFSFVTVDRHSMEREAARGDRPSARVVRAMRHLSFELSAAQFGITVTSLLVGFLAEPSFEAILDPLFHDVGLSDELSTALGATLALVIATVATMVFGELAPKNYSIAEPTKLARAVSGPFLLFSSVFKPIIRLFDNSSNRLVRAMGMEPADELRAARSPRELGYLVRESARSGALVSRAAEVVDRALRFDNKDASDVLTHRRDMLALPLAASGQEVLALARESGHSRFPLYGEDIDDIRLVVDIRDVLAAPDESAAALAAPAVHIPTTLDLGSVLHAIGEAPGEMVVVVDEYGGTAGLITMEDLVEELVGEVADEYDPPTEPAPRPGADSYTVSGARRLDDLYTDTGIALPAGPYDTVAGMVIAALGHLPTVGESVELAGWRWTVSAVTGRRVDTIEAHRIAP